MMNLIKNIMFLVTALFSSIVVLFANLDLELIDASFEGDRDRVKELLEMKVDPEAQNCRALYHAINGGYKEIAELLIEAGAEPNGENSQVFVDITEAKDDEEMKALLKRKGIVSRAVTAKLVKESDLNGLLKKVEEGELSFADSGVMGEILLSGNYKFVKYVFDNVPEIKEGYLLGVGLNDTRGRTTAEVLKIIREKIKGKGNAYHVEISLEMANDEDIMQYFSGFINPGGGDSYPVKEKPFDLNDMPYYYFRMYHEKVYQQIIDVAKKFDIPYLGICAGSQHLVLNSKGYLKMDGHLGLTRVDFIPGTIPHFLTLTEGEKARALSACKLRPVEFDAFTAHSYAGYKENLGEGVKLAAVSQEGVTEALSFGANKIGIQFHPEDHYSKAPKGGFNYHKVLLDNVFGMFEGYYRSMQYARKHGIEREVAKAAIHKVNKELIEYLENCVDKNSDMEFVLCGREPEGEYRNSVKRIAFLPGITPEDIAIAREGERDILIYFKDKSGQMKLKDRYGQQSAGNSLILEFADGSVFELDPGEVDLISSVCAEQLQKICLDNETEGNLSEENSVSLKNLKYYLGKLFKIVSD